METNTKELLQELGKSPLGNALRDFLDEQKKTIGNVKTTQSWEETLGRKFALKLIEDLFSFMDTPKVDKKEKNQYT